MDRQIFFLNGPAIRRNAAKACEYAPEGYRVEIKPAGKTRDQEEKYHAMLGDIAKQHTFMGRHLDTDSWKRLLVDAFAKVKRAEGDPLPGMGEIVPSLDGAGIVQLGFQTRRFTKKQAAEFVEFLYAWGDENGISWSEA